ncbi:hypothetical protein KUTeg_002562 [Tegillarca granosa]|uniref:Uncharacterized protein n=1 Tax=Tegillarca granosa TaxID=220873 RepID=A0ABQ9FUS0_TEGGR|nr:hypothetical protein KUTeg_002562 [Tegillarca granosa]
MNYFFIVIKILCFFNVEVEKYIIDKSLKWNLIILERALQIHYLNLSLNTHKNKEEKKDFFFLTL